MIGDGLSYLTNTPFFLVFLPHFITPPVLSKQSLSHTLPHTAHTHQQLLGFRKDSISAMFAWLVTRGGSKGVGAS